MAGPLFTPDHASPEQVAGFPVNTATDTYSPGLNLYELLTGRKASHAGPAERYASVDAFAADLCRFLQGEPVEAHGLARALLASG